MLWANASDRFVFNSKSVKMSDITKFLNEDTKRRKWAIGLIRGALDSWDSVFSETRRIMPTNHTPDSLEIDKWSICWLLDWMKIVFNRKNVEISDITMTSIEDIFSTKWDMDLIRSALDSWHFRLCNAPRIMSPHLVAGHKYVPNCTIWLKFCELMQVTELSLIGVQHQGLLDSGEAFNFSWDTVTLPPNLESLSAMETDFR